MKVYIPEKKKTYCECIHEEKNYPARYRVNEGYIPMVYLISSWLEAMLKLISDMNKICEYNAPMATKSEKDFF